MITTKQLFDEEQEALYNNERAFLIAEKEHKEWLLWQEIMAEESPQIILEEPEENSNFDIAKIFDDDKNVAGRPTSSKRSSLE